VLAFWCKRPGPRNPQPRLMIAHPLRPHWRKSIRRYQRPATVRAGERTDEPILRTEPDGDQQVSDVKWLRASWPEARACYSPTRVAPTRPLRLPSTSPTSPITNFNCSSRLIAPRTARRIRFRSAPGPEAGERE
jgi:hypothetical protein